MKLQRSATNHPELSRTVVVSFELRTVLVFDHIVILVKLNVSVLCSNS